MIGKLEDVVGGLQEAVKMGFEVVRNRFDTHDHQLQDLEKRVANLEACVISFHEKLTEESK